MRPGLGSFALGWNALQPEASRPPLTPAEFVRLAHRLGYPCVQIADNLPLHLLTAVERQELAEVARTLEVEIELGARGLTPQNLQHYVALAVELQSSFLRFVVDDADYHPSREEIVGIIGRHLGPLKKSNVVLGLENHDRFPAAELARIVEALDSPVVGICLDTANSFGAGEDPHTVLAALGPHTVNLHLKDVRFRRLDHHQGFTVEGTPLGDGQLPIAHIVAEIQRHGRCRSAILEHWVPPQPTAGLTFSRAMQWCQISTMTMQRLFPSGFVVPA